MNLDKIKRYGQKAGKEVLAVAEATYLTFKDPSLGWGQKAMLVAAISYFLLPLDTYPDFLPGGFADDLSVMLTALGSVGKVGKKHLQECRLKHGLILREEDPS